MALTPLETVTAFDEAIILRGDIDGAMTYAHPEITVREAPGLPYDEVYTGRAGIVKLQADVRDLWRKVEGTIDLQFWAVEGEAPSGGSLVVNRMTVRGRVVATGEEVDFVITEWFTVQDGLIVDVEPFYWDQAPLLRAR